MNLSNSTRRSCWVNLRMLSNMYFGGASFSMLHVFLGQKCVKIGFVGQLAPYMACKMALAGLQVAQNQLKK